MALTVDFYTSFKCSGRTPEILGAIENVRRMVGQKMPQSRSTPLTFKMYALDVCMVGVTHGRLVY